MPQMKLTTVVGMVKTTHSTDFGDEAAARAEGDEWLSSARWTVDREIEAGNLVAAEIPTYYVITCAETGATIHQSNRPRGKEGESAASFRI